MPDARPPFLPRMAQPADGARRPGRNVALAAAPVLRDRQAGTLSVMPSMMAFKAALGRIAFDAFTWSGW